MEEEKKNKLKKILSYIGCGIGCFILGLCVSNCANNKGKKGSNVNNNSQNEVVHVVNQHNIHIVDDNVSKYIEFSLIDLNDYSYPNLAEYVVDNVLDEGFFEQWQLNYQGVNYVYEEIDGSNIRFLNPEGEYLYFEYYGSSLDITGRFVNVDVPPFVDGLSLYVDSTQFDDVVEAIEQDIEENNEHYQQSIFGGLTESLVDFIGVIGSGFTSVFTIFYASGHITTFGTLSLIVVGVAIAYFLFRFIIGLIRLRG